MPYETETRRLPLPGVRRTTRYQAIDERGKEMHYVTSKGILSASNGMNLYRGCTHGCIYCDSRSDCYHMNHAFEDIEVKQNALELLEDTDYTATRMLGYLYRYTEPRIEDVIDEMIAILSDREEFIKKKEMEQEQAVINEIYRNGL